MAMMRKGGDWLVEDTLPESVLTPEALSDEHKLIRQTAAEFTRNDVMPVLPELEKKNWALSRTLVRRSGELGLLGADTPEEFGGIGLDKAAAVVVGEALGQAASFSTTFGAQTGLAIIPILCFGTDAQKAKYLPKIVSGELVGAYCLSESGSGSDALSARTRATQAADGSWVLNGEKMWITNGGFADVFIVFAQASEREGSGFSAFIVERSFPGVSSGKEEHKMGLHGSSTTPVILQDAKVPAENLLGEIGKGHRIAFNVLNYGRFKLAAMCMGGSKGAIADAVKYAASRKQFGAAILTFGAIRHKIGEMIAREYAVESMLYRTTGLIDSHIHRLTNSPSDSPDSPDSRESRDYAAASLSALEEFAIEASILKVAASELTDFVVDENVQIHGGNGFVHDYPAEGHYRDARVNRIFEGTNEINRLLIPGMLIKRALKGGGANLPLIAAAKAIQDSLVSAGPPASAPAGSGPVIKGMKDVSIALVGLALQTFGAKLEQEQEVMMLIADIIIDTFSAESAMLRAASVSGRPGAGQSGNALHQTAADLVIHNAAVRVEMNARAALPAIVSGDTLKIMQSALKRLLKVPTMNTVAARRALSDAAAEKKAYPF
jgi:alkylation response protein AidB-like acyl-CoA dehydrogenase